MLQRSENWRNAARPEPTLSYDMYDASVCNPANLYRKQQQQQQPKQTQLSGDEIVNKRPFMLTQRVGIQPLAVTAAERSSPPMKRAPISIGAAPAVAAPAVATTASVARRGVQRVEGSHGFAVPDVPPSRPKQQLRAEKQLRTGKQSRLEQQSCSAAPPFANSIKSRTTPSHQVRLPIAVHQQTPHASVASFRTNAAQAATKETAFNAQQYNSLAQSAAPDLFVDELREKSPKTVLSGPRSAQQAQATSSKNNSTSDKKHQSKSISAEPDDFFSVAIGSKSTDKSRARSLSTKEKSRFSASPKSSRVTAERENKRRELDAEKKTRRKKEKRAPSTATVKEVGGETEPRQSVESPGRARMSKQTKALITTIVSALVAAMLVFIVLALANPTFVQRPAPRNVDASAVEGPLDIKKAVGVAVFAGALTATMPFVWHRVEPYATSWIPWKNNNS